MHDFDLLAFFVAGLLGGGHCFGMCGGVVAAFSLQLPPGPRLRYHLGFNLGRIGGYALIGALVGAIGSLPALVSLQSIKVVLFVLANLLLIAVGLYLAGWSTWVTRLETVGRPVWRKIQPLLARRLPVRHWRDTFIIGGLWGWLPCGLVYTASLSALASGSVVRGALIMLAFGLGTLPNLLLIGQAAGRANLLLRKPLVRLVAGLLFVSFGIWRLVSLLLFSHIVL
ncbi:MAG: sulfite exporter TauE/SafE family protein [Silvimonas sp.]|nr:MULTISPECIES: sulfite exporter TauE/SafE family protein [Silvimonas]MDR3428624.1 sulfite exporter TauE/SafE family protein [Silvimonas sp.]